MKCYIITIAVCLLAAFVVADEEFLASGSENVATTQDLKASASGLSPLTEKHQEKRYVGGYTGYGSGLDGSLGYGGYGAGVGVGGYGAGIGGYGGYGGYNGYTGYGGYNSRLGLDGAYAGSPGYGGYGGYSGYSGYNTSPYNSYSSYNRIGTYPYNRIGYGSYPSSYYSGGYGSSIVGGGLGALGTPGYVPPVAGAAGYQYGPGISGTVY